MAEYTDETEELTGGKRRKQNRRKAPDGVTVHDIEAVLEQATDNLMQYSNLINEFVEGNAGKSDEEMGGKIGRVWLKVDKVNQTLEKSIETTKKTIESDSATSGDSDGLGSVRRAIRGFRKIINSTNKTIETLLKINPDYDISLYSQVIEENEMRIRELMAENGLEEEPAPVGRKPKNQNNDDY